MNTYVLNPPPFTQTAKFFKKQHALQQMYRAIQIYRTIKRGPNTGGWSNHPLVIAWENHVPALAAYIAAFAKRCGVKEIEKEYKKIAGKKIVYPPWTKDSVFISKFRGQLKGNMPVSYGHLWPRQPMLPNGPEFPAGRPLRVRIIVRNPPEPPKPAPLPIPEAKITVLPKSDPDDVEVSGTEDASIGLADLMDSIQRLRELTQE